MKECKFYEKKQLRGFGIWTLLTRQEKRGVQQEQKETVSHNRLRENKTSRQHCVPASIPCVQRELTSEWPPQTKTPDNQITRRLWWVIRFWKKETGRQKFRGRALTVQRLEGRVRRGSGGSQFIGVSWLGKPSGWLSKASVGGLLLSCSSGLVVGEDGLILVWSHRKDEK